MSIITRELLAHYLRANGWTDDGGGGLRFIMPSGRVLLWGARAPVDDGVSLAIFQINADRSRDVKACLGLCAAADRLLASVEQYPSADRRSTEQAYAVAELCARIYELLTAAGVDPAAWEKARRT